MAGIIVAATLCIAVLCFLVQFGVVRSHGNIPQIYHVGDAKGWDLYPQVMDWPRNKHFKAGDTLVFKYSNPVYGVAKVDALEFKRCQKNRGTEEYNSGNDRFTLQKGFNYFISIFPDYCGYGMRIQVYAQ
ncbi:basic blue protein-like [Macadamia integrifolia]|uniref:basic blue protein-like n=1 Tax=Macadamia integrifolia TaxID=60698 RepID=UPI001C4F99C2|nr:basic blue protein-like [Macadamia integrifolia]